MKTFVRILITLMSIFSIIMAITYLSLAWEQKQPALILGTLWALGIFIALRIHIRESKKKKRFIDAYFKQPTSLPDHPLIPNAKSSNGNTSLYSKQQLDINKSTQLQKQIAQTSENVQSLSYVIDKNTISHLDGQPIIDAEVPYLIELGYRQALENDQKVPAMNRTEREEELGFQFLYRHGHESEALCDKFIELQRAAFQEEDIDTKIKLLQQTIDAFEKAKQWHYKYSKGAKIHFQDMWERLHNSKNPCFSWIDSIKEELETQIGARDVIIPRLTYEIDESNAENFNTLPIPKFPEFKLHPDLEGLIWFADGPMKNYTPRQDDPTITFIKDIYFSSKIGEEHSAIYTSLPIAIPKEPSAVPRPPYYPRYDMLAPEQRWLYLLTLSDPYGNHDVGYAFILYYGLERHLAIGDFDRAFEVILKMRKVYKNGSFQSYSAYALILSSVLRNRVDKIANLKNEVLASCPFDLLLVIHSIEMTGISAKELMENSSACGFTNRRYITSDPELFLKCLENVLIEKFNDIYMPFDKTNSTMPVPLFANPSFLTTTINIPDFLHDERFTSKAFNCLQEAHNKVKSIKAEMRKGKTK